MILFIIRSESNLVWWEEDYFRSQAKIIEILVLTPVTKSYGFDQVILSILFTNMKYLVFKFTNSKFSETLMFGSTSISFGWKF